LKNTDRIRTGPERLVNSDKHCLGTYVLYSAPGVGLIINLTLYMGRNSLRRRVDVDA
jgi:hypothetical protein